VCVYIYINLCVCIYTHTCMYIYIYVYKYIYVHIYIHIYTYIYIYIYAHIHVYVHIYIYIYLYIYIYTHTYIQLYTHVCTHMKKFISICFSSRVQARTYYLCRSSTHACEHQYPDPGLRRRHTVAAQEALHELKHCELDGRFRRSTHHYRHEAAVQRRCAIGLYDLSYLLVRVESFVVIICRLYI